MKTTIRLSLSLMMLCSLVGTADADHRRQLDDSAFAVLSDARDLRWIVRDHLTQSGQLRYLCRESDDVFAASRNLQGVIFAGRTLPIICRNIERVQQELCEFEEVLQRCPLASGISHHRGSRRGSYVGINHGYGQSPGLIALQTVRQMQQTLQAMQALASGQPIVGPVLTPGPVHQYPPHINPPPPAFPNQPRLQPQPIPHPTGPQLPGPLSRYNRDDHRSRLRKSGMDLGDLLQLAIDLGR